MLLLLLLLLLTVKISGRLRRIETRLGQAAAGGVERDRLPDEPDPTAGGAFDEFLKEDPARRRLTKSEQFAAYRRWRQERGLNWSNS